MKPRAHARTRKRRLAALLGVGLIVGPWLALHSAQDIRVPVEIQFELLTKILVFDRNLKARVGEEIVVGVAFQSLYRASLTAQDEFLAAAGKTPELRIEGLAVRFVAIELKDGASLDEALTASRVDVLYVTPLRAYDIAAISAATRAHAILSFASVPDYVRDGLTVGIDAVGGKPKILINLRKAKEEGCDFSSKLLNLATVIQ